MKVLIGYDGSENAQAMLTDLKRAGLPSDTEAKVLTITEIWLPAPPSYGLIETSYAKSFPLDISLAKQLAEKASQQLKELFPTWQITFDYALGAPARELLDEANNWHPDLIVVGSQGLSALSRFFLGSVSQKVVTEAHTSVRIGRGRERDDSEPVKIVVGVDGSPESQAAIKVIAQREWPKGSKVLLITATDHVPAKDFNKMLDLVTPDNTKPMDELDQIKRLLAQVLEAELIASGLSVTSLITAGDPRKVLIDEANKWGADTIFIGSRGFGRFQRLLLGSVSTAISARADCSVEVVRLLEASATE